MPNDKRVTPLDSLLQVLLPLAVQSLLDGGAKHRDAWVEVARQWEDDPDMLVRIMVETHVDTKLALAKQAAFYADWTGFREAIGGAVGYLACLLAQLELLSTEEKP